MKSDHTTNRKLGQLVLHLGGPSDVNKKIGINKSTVSRWFRVGAGGREGLPSILHLLKLAEVAQEELKVSIDIHAIGMESLAWKRLKRDEAERERRANESAAYRRDNVEREPYLSPSRRHWLRENADRTRRMEAKKFPNTVRDVPENNET